MGSKSEYPLGEANPPSIIFMSGDCVDRLVEWDTKVMAGVATLKLTQPERVENAVKFFRVVLVVACLTEAAHKVGAKSVGDVIDAMPVIESEVRRTSGFELSAIAAPQKARLGEISFEKLREVRVMSLVATRDMVTSFFSSTHIASLKQSARAIELEEELSVVLDRLNDFLRRTDPFLRVRLRVLADQYQGGDLSMQQVADLLGLDIPDALALMDQLDLARPVETIALSDAERADRLEAIKRDRKARAGAPRNDQSMAVRTAISSQRLEGIDARSCLTTNR